MTKSKMLNIGTAVLGIIGIILYLLVMIADGNEAIDSSVGAYVIYAIILLIITAFFAVFFSILNLIKHPKSLKRTLIGVLFLVVLLVITYFLASGEAVTDSIGNVIKGGEAGATSKWVSALINFTGLLGLIGIVVIAWGIVKSPK